MCGLVRALKFRSVGGLSFEAGCLELNIRGTVLPVAVQPCKSGCQAPSGILRAQHFSKTQSSSGDLPAQAVNGGSMGRGAGGGSGATHLAPNPNMNLPVCRGYILSAVWCLSHTAMCQNLASAHLGYVE